MGTPSKPIIFCTPVYCGVGKPCCNCFAWARRTSWLILQILFLGGQVVDIRFQIIVNLRQRKMDGVAIGIDDRRRRFEAVHLPLIVVDLLVQIVDLGGQPVELFGQLIDLLLNLGGGGLQIVQLLGVHPA